MRAARRLLPSVLALTVAAGCPRLPPPGLPEDAGGLREAVRAAQARVVRVSGSARLKVKTPGAGGTLQALAAAERPGRLRLEVLDFFGAPAVVLVAAGGRFGFLDARAGTWTEGDATPANVSQLLPVALPAEELVELLCGAAPLLPGAAVAARPADGLMRLWIEGQGLTQRLDVGAEAAVEASRVTQAGGGGRRAGYDLDFGVFRHLAGVRFPTEVRLDAADGQARVELAWGQDLEVNGPASPRLFSLEPPPGARVVELTPGAELPRPVLPFRDAE